MARGLLAQANRASQRARLGTTFPRMAAGFSPPLPNWLARRHAQTCRRGGRGGEEELSWRHRPETGGGWTPAGALEMKSPVHRAGRRGGGASPEFGAPQASWVRLLENGSAWAALPKSEAGAQRIAPGWGLPARPGSASPAGARRTASGLGVRSCVNRKRVLPATRRWRAPIGQGPASVSAPRKRFTCGRWLNASFPPGPPVCPSLLSFVSASSPASFLLQEHR
ncbi:uncharacterized protein LOC101671516 [Mustela putorius furo]|uniref:Uncharacterized protein LOC101671516 n=1 Tax=Mustela putorius furo TaxID=9669 RepID=A0A8U0NC77_MUSPF|nr:uncharacterized protein LOC101671516 [Mustela putorius furo]